MKITCTLRPNTATLLRQVAKHTGLLPEDLAIAGLNRVMDEVVTHGFLVATPNQRPPGKDWKSAPSATPAPALTR